MGERWQEAQSRDSMAAKENRAALGLPFVQMKKQR